MKIKQPCPYYPCDAEVNLNRLGKATELEKFKDGLNNAVLDPDS
jgi:hypothetical protein